MTTYDELHAQNHKITELSNLLSHLLKERSLCDNGECCKLFTRYMDQVTHHMETVDRNLYSELLLCEDTRVNNTAKSFIEGTVGIRRIMKGYMSKWCRRSDKRFVFGKDGKGYARFLADSETMFSIILDRIQKETEILYPMVRRLQDGQQRAA